MLHKQVVFYLINKNIYIYIKMNKLIILVVALVVFVYFGGKCLAAGPRHLCDQVFEKRHKDTIGGYTRILVA